MAERHPQGFRVLRVVTGGVVALISGLMALPASAQTTAPSPILPASSTTRPFQPGGAAPATSTTTTTAPGTLPLPQQPGAQNPGVPNPGTTVPGVPQVPGAPGANLPPGQPGAIPQPTSTGIPQDSSAERIAQGEQVVISTGQLDLAPRMINGTWTFLMRDASTTPAVWRNPRDVVIHLKDDARIPRPASPDYNFLDVPAGQPVYAITQIPSPQTVWLGVSTQDLQAGVTMQRGANLTLTGVDGSGYAVSFVQDSALGKPRVLWDTRRPDAQPAWFDTNTYTHPNWVFSAPGTYRLGLRWSTKTSAGNTVTADATLRFAVGTTAPVQAAAALEDLRADIGLAPSTGTAAREPAKAASGPTWFDSWKYILFGMGILATFLVASWSVFLDRFRGYRLRKQATREVLVEQDELDDPAMYAPAGDVVTHPRRPEPGVQDPARRPAHGVPDAAGVGATSPKDTAQRPPVGTGGHR